tara:strand:+ start:2835 stop:4223 length:1389 start_codon:yes stop_codon:yes gene_type:complete
MFLLGAFLFPLAIGVTGVQGQAGADAVDARRAQLEAELAQLEQQIEEQRQLVQSKQNEAVSLERDLAIIDAEIKKAQLAIRAREIAISNLGTEITGKTQKIGQLDEKAVRQRASLEALLRKRRELDSVSLVEVFFGRETLSEFFKDIDTFGAIEDSLQVSFQDLRITRDVTEDEREVLVDKRTEEIELKQIQELEEQRIKEREDEKEHLLEVTRGVEAAYAKVLQGQERSAAQIRSELFTLRGSEAIPFGEALEYANFAYTKTGVRPAFVLGILAQESNLGAFLGTGVWTEDMHPTRDRPVYEYITGALGLDPNQMPVSRAPSYGWGGAMGPAQFIPSTWVCYGGFINTKTGDCNNAQRSLAWTDYWQGPWQYEAGEDRIRRLLGKASPANPWTPQDAIMASSLLLSENGADEGGYDAERLAALRYFAGWTNATNPAYGFYGDDVMGLASKYQKQIDILEGN